MRFMRYVPNAGNVPPLSDHHGRLTAEPVSHPQVVNRLPPALRSSPWQLEISRSCAVVLSGLRC